MHIICTPIVTDRQSGESGPHDAMAKQIEIPEGYVITQIETLHPHRLDDMSVTIVVHLEREGREPLDLKFEFEAFFYAVTGTKTLLVQ